MNILSSSQNNQSFYSIADFFVPFTTLSERNVSLQEEKSNVSFGENTRSKLANTRQFYISLVSSFSVSKINEFFQGLWSSTLSRWTLLNRSCFSVFFFSLFLSFPRLSTYPTNTYKLTLYFVFFSISVVNASRHGTSRQTNTGALALWDCVRTDGRADGRTDGQVTSKPNQNFSHSWVSQIFLAMGLRARSSAINFRN